MRLAVVTVAVLLMAAACSTEPLSVEGQWRLVSVIDDGAVLNVPPSERGKASVNMALADGGIRTAAACNIAAGSYEFDSVAGTLTGSAFGVTLMACPHSEEYDWAITRILSGDPVDVVLMADTMLWTRGDRILRFVRTGEV